MTRKDFQLIADVFAGWQPDAYDEFMVKAKMRIYQGIADKLEKDNPRFDRQRFYSACFPTTPHTSPDTTKDTTP